MREGVEGGRTGLQPQSNRSHFLGRTKKIRDQSGCERERDRAGTILLLSTK